MIHRHHHGDAQVIVGRIATMPRSLKQLSATFPAVPVAELSQAIAPETQITWSFNLSVLKLGETVVLVDTGFSFDGDGPPTPTGVLLKEAGMTADDVDIVLVTHCHGDHIGGLVRDAEPAFGRARLAISKSEYDFWSGRDGEAHFGEDGVRTARTAFEVYRDRIDLLTEPGPLVEASEGSLAWYDLSGHTPGHIGIVVTSRSQTMRLLTDAFHAALQLKNLAWGPRFDIDSRRAAQSRTREVERAARSGEIVHLYHLAFPGLGRIRSDQDHYCWEPLA